MQPLLTGTLWLPLATHWVGGSTILPQMKLGDGGVDLANAYPNVANALLLAFTTGMH